MPSSNFDILHLRFARLVDDPVAAASTAGKVYTVAQRSDYINRANKFIQEAIYYGEGFREARQRIVLAVGTTTNVGEIGTLSVLASDDGTQDTVDVDLPQYLWDAVVDMAASFALANKDTEQSALVLKRATEFLATLK